MSESKSEQNRVRQVLMNELGLTRELIRDEVSRIVTDAITRTCNAPDFQQRIDNIIASKVGKALEYYGNAESLSKFILAQTTKEAESQARGLIRERMRVTLTLEEKAEAAS